MLRTPDEALLRAFAEITAANEEMWCVITLPLLPSMARGL